MPCVSPRTFGDWVRRGLTPKGIKIGSLPRWMWERARPHGRAVVEGKMLDEEDDGETRSTGSSPMVLDSAMSGTAFRACVEQVLMPTLRPGDIIVMGNLPTHKAEGVRQAIEVAVASYSTTPPNSPDFKPIEKAFTKLSAPPSKSKAHSRSSVGRNRRDRRAFQTPRMRQLLHGVRI